MTELEMIAFAYRKWRSAPSKVVRDRYAEQIVSQCERATAFYVRKKRPDAGPPDPDLMQVGRLAVIRAIEDYDPDHQGGASLWSFIVGRVKGAIQNDIRDHGDMIRLSRGVMESKASALRSLASLEAAEGRSLTHQEIEDSSLTDTQKQALVAGGETVSLDAMTYTKDEPADTRVLPDVLINTIARDQLLDMLRRIRVTSPVQRECLLLWYTTDMSKSEIGRRLGMTHSYACYIIKTYTRKLRQMAGVTD